MTQAQLYQRAYFEQIRGKSAQDGLYQQFRTIVEKEAGCSARTILDLGCGRGELLKLLSESERFEVFGCDFSEAAVELSRDLLGGALGERVVFGSACDRTLFSRGQFDLVCMMDVVEHLEPYDLQTTFENVRFWLGEDGVLVVHTFPTRFLHELYCAFLFLTRQVRELKELRSIHCNVQTRTRLKHALEAAGFEVDSLWLKNNFTLTSSRYQRLPEGALKNILGFLLDRILGGRTVGRLFDSLGMLELSQPSIYAVASVKSPSRDKKQGPQS